MDDKGKAAKTPPQIVEELQAWLRTKIGDVAEDDWLALDDFDTYCNAVRREWERANAVSVANPEVKRNLLKRCARNVVRAQSALSDIVEAWILRKQ